MWRCGYCVESQEGLKPGFTTKSHLNAQESSCRISRRVETKPNDSLKGLRRSFVGRISRRVETKHISSSVLRAPVLCGRISRRVETQPNVTLRRPPLLGHGRRISRRVETQKGPKDETISGLVCRVESQEGLKLSVAAKYRWVPRKE